MVLENVYTKGIVKNWPLKIKEQNQIKICKISWIPIFIFAYICGTHSYKMIFTDTYK